MSMRRRTAPNATRLRRARLRCAEPLLERLESRCLYSVALTGELALNTDPTGVQQTSIESHSAIAVDSSGDSIAVWSGSGSGDASGIFARRLDASGNPIGSDFRVNTTTA